MQYARKRLGIALMFCAAWSWMTARADDSALGRIDVVAPAPLPGLGVPAASFPGNVQTVSGDDLKGSPTGTLSDYLDASFDGVTENQTQDDPFQTDLQYHGFTASPLLGAPEGLSVYVDGVRINEAFGDTVNWDLIPESAIQQVTLMPGSNPVFGLNTLGGALVIDTRGGDDNPGYEAQSSFGSYGGQDAEGSVGGAAGHLDGFLTAHYYQENGWRDDSPSRLSQVFGKAGWHDELGRVDLSYTHVDDALVGNGTTPASMLAVNDAAIYTAPDATRNHLDFLSLTGLRFVNDSLYISGNVYYRHLVTDSENGDANDNNYLDAAAGLTPRDCIPGATDPAVTAFCSIGVDRRSGLGQRSYGAGAQATHPTGAEAGDQIVLGFSWDGSEDHYSQDIQYGDLSAGRVFIPGIVAPRTISDIAGSTGTLGIYAMDSYSPASWLQLTGSLRWNQERLTLGGSSVDTELDDAGDGFGAPHPVTGDHRFQRLNPAVGFVATPVSGMDFYGDYNEGMRAPTVVELGCADPAAPCGLPDDFAGDPPLNPVVARTFELGVRSTGDTSLGWGLDVFRTRNSDDIQFISSPGNRGTGYFANVGDTLRQGIDAHLQGLQGPFTWRLSVSVLRATYQSTFLESGADSNSSAAADGVITVRPGDPLPLTPERTGRVSLGYRIGDRWKLGADALYASGSNLHGNEDGLNQADAVTGSGDIVAGSGHIGGYTLIDARADFQCTQTVSLFFKMDNVFDRRYTTAGFLGDDSFRPDGSFRADGSVTHEDEVSPGTPRSIWLGVRMSWR